MFYNIQGLRAIAVISVILFHYQVAYFGGGFLGVDIFFVISGYLITLILDEEINTKNILKFYLKRIRRLLPALLFIIILSLILGFLLMSETSYERLGKTSLSSIFFISNFFYWREWGYFDLYSLNKPLLHTWSLSLEMQFYFIFPIILLLINSLIKKIKIIYKLFFLFIIFSIFTELLLSAKEIAAFYLLPFRISEFLIGSIGYYYEKNKNTSTIQNNYLFIVSLAILFFFIINYDKNIKFPGLNAMIPCFATVLLILNKKSYLSKKILENKIILFFGNISYSLFLVHWPLFVFYRFYIFNEPTIIEKFLLLLFSIIFSYFLNRYIENYFKKNISIKNNFKFLFSFLIIFIFSTSIIFNNGFSFRIENNSVKKNEDKIYLNKEFINLESKKILNKKCVINSNNENLDFIIFGDSYANMYTQAFLKYSENYNKNFCYVHLSPSCNFLKSEIDQNFIKNNCHKRLETAINYLSEQNFSNLVISNSWDSLNDNEWNTSETKFKNFYDRIFGNSNKKIIVLLNVPGFSNGISMERCAKFPNYIIKERDCYNASRKSSEIVKRNFLNEKIKSTIKNSNTGNSLFLDPYDFFCDNDKCKQVIDEKDIYVDDDHITFFSSVLLLKFWEEKFNKFIE